MLSYLLFTEHATISSDFGFWINEPFFSEQLVKNYRPEETAFNWRCGFQGRILSLEFHTLT